MGMEGTWLISAYNLHLTFLVRGWGWRARFGLEVGRCLLSRNVPFSIENKSIARHRVCSFYKHFLWKIQIHFSNEGERTLPLGVFPEQRTARTGALRGVCVCGGGGGEGAVCSVQPGDQVAGPEVCGEALK